MTKDVRRALLVARRMFAEGGDTTTTTVSPGESAFSSFFGGGKSGNKFGSGVSAPATKLPLQEPLPAATVNYANLMPPGMGVISPATPPSGGLPNVPGFTAGPSGFGSLVPTSASLTQPFGAMPMGSPNLGAPTPSVGGFNPALAQATFNYAPAAAVPKPLEPTPNSFAPTADATTTSTTKNPEDYISNNGTTSESDGPGDSGDATAFASGGHVGHTHAMDPRDLPGIHVRTAHTFAAGGAATQGQDQDEGEGFDAYHGSPHAFERFDPSKIGTGEGAQAYGHGLYFAGDEGIARGYRNRLSLGRNQFNIVDKKTGQPIDENTLGYPHVKNFYDSNAWDLRGGDKERAKVKFDQWKNKIIKEQIPDWENFVSRSSGKDKEFALEELSKIRQTIAHLDAAHSLLDRTVATPTGHLYHVRIKANPEHFLDWDAPLSEQHPHVQKALSGLGFTADPEGLRAHDDALLAALHGTGSSAIPKLPDDPTGEKIHRLLVGGASEWGHTKEGAIETAKDLHAAGIPGIKYWDAGSRAQGQGTRNYVIFNPDIIHVKRRYADGGLIQDKYPSHYMPGVGRQVMADGGDPGSDPLVQKAMDVAQQAQPAPVEGAMGVAKRVAMPGRARFEIAPARGAIAAPMAASAPNLTEPGSVNIKSLSEAFRRAIENHLALPPEQQISNARRAENNVAKFVGRGKSGKVNSVLTANKKLMKAQTAGEGETPLTLPDGRTLEMTGLALMPDYREGQFRVCGNSGVCRDLCLGKESGQYRFDPTATQSEMPTTKEQIAESAGRPRVAALKRTMAMLRDPESFAVYLHELIDDAQQVAERRGSHLGVRLNVLSDLSPKILEPIIKANPRVSFYDYTKMNYNPVAPNHHYTYSSTGLSQPDRGVENPFSNWRQMRDRLDQGSNVAMAFAHGKGEAFPEMIHDAETGRQYRVVSGDEHDFRPLDMVPEGEPGVIIALKNMAASSPSYKYEEAARGSHGFFVHHEPDFLKNNRGTFAKDENGKRIPRNKVYTVAVQPQKRGASATPQEAPQ